MTDPDRNDTPRTDQGHNKSTRGFSMNDNRDRHNHNPYAIAHLAHTSPSAPPFTMPEDDWPTRVRNAAARFYITYRQIGDGIGARTPAEFLTRVRTDLKDYEVLLHTPEILPDFQRFAAMITTSYPEAAEHRLDDEAAANLTMYDPPDPWETSDPSTATRYFKDLFLIPTAVELFIAAHRWPDGIPVCTECGSKSTTVSRQEAPDSTDHPDPQLSMPLGPDLSWRCNRCAHQFLAVTSTIMEHPPAPPQEWLYLAMLLIHHDRTANQSNKPPPDAGSFFSLGITDQQSSAMTDRIRSVISPANPSTAPTITPMNALKMLARSPS